MLEFGGKQGTTVEEATWEWKDWIWGLKNEYDLCKKPEHHAFKSNKDAKFKVN